MLELRRDANVARELYAAAEYEDALTILNRLRQTPSKPEDVRTIDQYRAFCLLALGRAAEALLTGQRALPKKLLDMGYKFRFPTAEAALRDVLRR